MLLWDLQQVTAYHDGGPQPVLPTADDDANLLDRREAAALLDVKPRSFDGYKSDAASPTTLWWSAGAIAGSAACCARTARPVEP